MADSDARELVPVFGRGVRAVGALLPRFRGASIRGKVSWALVGVVLLVVPQVLLTVAFMMQLSSDSERIQTLTGHAAMVSRVAHALTDLERAPSPRPAGDAERPSDERGRLDDALTALERRIEDLHIIAGSTPELAGLALDAIARLDRFRRSRSAAPAAPPDAWPTGIWLARIGKARDGIADDITRWIADHERPTTDELERRLFYLHDLAVRQLDEVVAEGLADALIAEANNGAAAAARRAGAETLADAARNSVSQLRLRLDEQIASSSDAARAAVDRANRYIVTLVLLTVVYIVAVLLLLPNRLVRPLNHLVAVMDRVADGYLEVETRIRSDDEVGRVARALDLMISRVRTFDALKRDRIFEDRRRLNRLLELVAYPVAILDTHHRIEYANTPFRSLFDLPARCEDLSLTRFIDGSGVDEFVLLLEETLRRQHEVQRLATTLRTPAGVRRYFMSLEVTRDRRGHVASLIMRLEPRASEGDDAPRSTAQAADDAPPTPAIGARDDA